MAAIRSPNYISLDTGYPASSELLPPANLALPDVIVITQTLLVSPPPQQSGGGGAVGYATG